MNANAWGSRGPKELVIYRLKNKNKNWKCVEANPKAIAYTGLLIQGDELKIATPAPRTEYIKELTPNSL